MDEQRMGEDEVERLTEITITELEYSWPRYLVAVLRQIKLRFGVDELTPEHINVINAAMSNCKPSNSVGALTDDDAMTIANSGNVG